MIVTVTLITPPVIWDSQSTGNPHKHEDHYELLRSLQVQSS